MLSVGLILLLLTVEGRRIIHIPMLSPLASHQVDKPNLFRYSLGVSRIYFLNTVAKC